MNRIGDNNIVNRPNYGNNSFSRNVYGGNNYNFGGNNYSNWFGGGGFGGWGVGTGGWRGGAGGWGGAWNHPYRGYHGNWYRGWGNNYLNLGLGGGGLGYPGYYGYTGLYNTFPSWGLASYAGWGLGTLASGWMTSSFVNPFYTAQVAAPGIAPPVVYDYSQPINVAMSPPVETVAQDAVSQFDQARESFKNGDYATALNLTDAALQEMPNDPTLHEFRGLVLFALGRYDEAAAVDYAVLSAGPGWTWSTMAGLYADDDTYTNQLRALEARVRAEPTSASTSSSSATITWSRGTATPPGGGSPRSPG